MSLTLSEYRSAWEGLLSRAASLASDPTAPRGELREAFSEIGELLGAAVSATDAPDGAVIMWRGEYAERAYGLLLGAAAL